MSDPTAEFEKLKTLHGSAVLMKEGGIPVVLLPDLPFKAVGKDQKMTVLLHPASHSGYATRLFFERKIEGVAASWGEHRVVDRQWWALSWKDVHATLPWPAMLCAHLRAVA